MTEEKLGAYERKNGKVECKRERMLVGEGYYHKHIVNNITSLLTL